MSETFGQHTISLRGLPECLICASGAPMPGMLHRIVDPITGRDVAPGATGELLVEGDTLFIGIIGRTSPLSTATVDSNIGSMQLVRATFSFMAGLTT
jgi:hypothetical protein